MTDPRDPRDPRDDFHKTILDNLSDGVYYVDRERVITYWNRGAERISGHRAEDIVGRQCFSNILDHVDADGRRLCYAACPLAETMEDGQPREVTIWLRHEDGHRKAVRTRTAPIRGTDGEIIGGVEVFTDDAAILAAEEDARRARHDALTDGLTGLPNRRHFDAAIAARIENLARYGWRFGLLIADIDRFKQVNDEYGHTFGDAVLANVAATLSSAIRGGDTAARWGGEEFAVLVEAPDEAGLLEMGERLRVLVERSEIRRDGHVVRPTISVGGALARPGESSEQLFNRADGALLEAKQSGRNQVSVRERSEGAA